MLNIRISLQVRKELIGVWIMEIKKKKKIIDNWMQIKVMCSSTSLVGQWQLRSCDNASPIVWRTKESLKIISYPILRDASSRFVTTATSAAVSSSSSSSLATIQEVFFFSPHHLLHHKTFCDSKNKNKKKTVVPQGWVTSNQDRRVSFCDHYCYNYILYPNIYR